ncbi:hypothetical protein ACLB1G_04530 [Oxalobacteraceae bacterium A2-2]
MLNHALFGIIEEAGYGVLVLGEYLEREELLASRLTRAEVRRQLLIMASAIAGIPPVSRALLPELEWEGWDRMRRELAPEQDTARVDEALWFGLRSLTPATLTWMRVYRKDQPELFTYTV